MGVVRIRKLTRTGAAVGATVAVTALFALWVSLGWGGPVVTSYVDDLVTVLAAASAVAAGAVAASRHRGEERRFWAWMAAACGAWTFAEVLWAVYDLSGNGKVPVPSWADVGYLAAIPLAAVALLAHPAVNAGSPRRARVFFDGLVVACAALLVSWLTVLGPLWGRADLTTFGGIVAVAYPFGDVVLIVLVVLTARALPRGDRLPENAVLCGVVCMALSDSAYTYLTAVKSYSTGSWIDAGWVAAYLAFAVGAFAASGQRRILLVTTRSTRPVTSLMAPYLVLLPALVVVTVEVSVGRPLNRLEWSLALTLALLVVIRQSLFYRARIHHAGHQVSTPALPGGQIAPFGRAEANGARR